MPMIAGSVAAIGRLEEALTGGGPDNQSIAGNLTWGDLRVIQRELLRRELRIDEERDRATQYAGEGNEMRDALDMIGDLAYRTDPNHRRDALVSIHDTAKKAARGGARRG